MTHSAIAVAVAAGSGLAIALLQKTLWNKSSRQLRDAEAEFSRAVRHLIPSANVFIMGGLNSYPVTWVTTATDPERDQLQQREGLREQFCTALRQSGYPASDLPFVQFVFESQETVDRDFKGSWSNRKYIWRRERHLTCLGLMTMV